MGAPQVGIMSESSKWKGLSPEQKDLAKNLSKQLRESLDELKPEERLRQAIAKSGASRFDSPFVPVQTMTNWSKSAETTAQRVPDTVITIEDVSIDLHTNPFDSYSSYVSTHKYSLEMAALISVSSVGRKYTLIDTDKYEHTKLDVTLDSLLFRLEHVIGFACENIATQLLDWIENEATDRSHSFPFRFAANTSEKVRDR